MDNQRINESDSSSTSQKQGIDFQKIIFSNLLGMDGMQGNIGLLASAISSVQSFAIAYTIIYPVVWHSGYGDWIQSCADALMLQSNLFHKTSGFVLGVVLIFCPLIFFVISAVLRNSTQSGWSGLTLRTSNLFLNIAVGIAAYPLSSVFGSFLSCVNVGNGALTHPSQCWDGANVGYAVSSIIMFVLLIMLVLVKDVMLAETIGYDTSILSKAHGRIEAFEQVVYCGILFMISALAGASQTSTAVQWAINIVRLVLTMAVAFLHIYWGAQYFRFVQYFKTVTSALLAWSCFSVIILQSQNPQGYEAALFMYLAGLMFACLSVWLVGWRRRLITNKATDSITNPFELEIHIRLRLIAAGTYWTRYSSVVAGKKPEVGDTSFIWANEAFGAGIKKFRESPFIYISYANFLFGKNNHNLLINVVSKCRKSCQIPVDIEFMFFKRGKTVETLYSTNRGVVEVQNYFRYLYLSRSSETITIQLMARKVGFLSELRKSNPTLSKLHSEGVAAYALILQLQLNFTEMFNLNPQAKVVRKYASLMSNVVNAPVLTRNLVAYADRLDLEHSSGENKSAMTGIETQAGLFEERHAVFVLSGEEGSLGDILECNIGAVDLFEFQATSEIVGTNINTLMPSPFQELHHGLLRKYLETGFASVLEVTRNVIARPKSGFIFEVKLFVRQVINDQGQLNFVGTMAKSEDQADLMIMDPTGHIVAISLNCRGLFETFKDMDSDSVLDKIRSVHISQLLPDWKSSESLYRREHGNSVTIGTNSVHVKVIELKFIKSQFCVVEMWVDHTNAKRQSGPIETESESHDVVENLVPLSSPVTNAKTSSVPHSRQASLAGTKTGGQSKSKRKNVAESLGSSSSADSGNSDFEEAYEEAERNTALNASRTLHNIMADYSTRIETKYLSTSDSFRKMAFRILIILFLTWLIGSNFYLTEKFGELITLLSGLASSGQQIFELQRFLTTTRSIQFYHGCPEVIVNTTFCQALHTLDLTEGTPRDYHNILIAGSNVYRKSSHNLMNILNKKLKTDDVMKFIEPSLFARDFIARYWIPPRSTVDTPVNLIEIIQKTVRCAVYLSADEDPQYFISSFRGLFDNATIPPSYFDIADTSIPRYDRFTRNNSPRLTDAIEAASEGYDTLYSTLLHSVESAIIIIAIVPVILIILATSMYIIPAVSRLINWQRDILTVLFRIPPKLIRWWFNGLLKSINRQAAESDDPTNAELLMFLQQSEISDFTGNSDKDKEKSKLAGKRDEGVTKMNITIKQTIKSLSAGKMAIKMSLSILMLALMPLTTLILLQEIKETVNLSRYIEFTNRLMMHMGKAHYDLREGVVYHFANETDYKLMEAERGLDSIRKIKEQHRYMVYGMTADDVPDEDADSGHTGSEMQGLNTKQYYREILFGNACTVVDAATRASILPRLECEEFEDGLLTHGLNGALISYGQRLQEIHQFLVAGAGVGDPQFSRANIGLKLKSMESLLAQITTITLATRNHFEDIIAFVNYLSTVIIQPLQISFAFIGALVVYFYVYIPSIKRLDGAVLSMHGMLTMLYVGIEPQLESDKKGDNGPSAGDNNADGKAILATAELDPGVSESGVNSEVGTGAVMTTSQIDNDNAESKQSGDGESEMDVTGNSIPASERDVTTTNEMATKLAALSDHAINSSRDILATSLMQAE